MDTHEKKSRKVALMIGVETCIIIGLLLALVLIPERQKQSKPMKMGVTPATVFKDRLVIYRPTANEVLTDGVVQVAGKMKGFYEGTMLFRILDSKGSVKLSENINATTDNYSRFASFQQAFSYPPTDRGMHTVEFVDVSAKDGAEKVLLSDSRRIQISTTFSVSEN
ncbi:MAG: Gmad2 immunoglobulin-like domain-containing protein [Patescibacteria group bacterium]